MPSLSMTSRSSHILRFCVRRSGTSSAAEKLPLSRRKSSAEKPPLWKVFAWFITGGGAIFGGLKLIAEMSKETKVAVKEVIDTSKLLRDMFATGVKSSKIPHGKAWMMSTEHKFVKREGIEAMVREYVNETVSDKYMVVYGNKGIGKSCFVEHALTNMEGVAMVRLTNQSDKTAILDNLTKVVMGKITSEKFDQDEVKAALQTVSFPQLKEEKTPTGDTSASDGRETLPSGSTKPAVPGKRRATIVFEIERGDDNDKCIDSVRSLAKDLAEVARIIIVLSEANAVLNFGRDLHREIFIHVGDLTRIEAETLLLQREVGLKLSREEKDRLFENVGTSPGTLVDFCGSHMSVDEFVAHCLSRARGDLGAFPLVPILQALKEHPEGVEPGYFKHAEYKGVDMSSPRAVGAIMKKHENPILFDIQKGMYMPLSRAHKVALKSYVVPAVTAPAGQSKSLP